MKAVFFIGLMFLMVSCAPSAGAVIELPTASAVIPSDTATEQPTATPTATETSTPTATASGCLHPTMPENGATFAGGKQISFVWETHPGAAYYILFLISPDGLQNKYKSVSTFSSQDIKTVPKGTNYEWSVMAYDANDQLICQSDSFLLVMLPAGSKIPARTGTPTATDSMLRSQTPTPTDTASSGTQSTPTENTQMTPTPTDIVPPTATPTDNIQSTSTPTDNAPPPTATATDNPQPTPTEHSPTETPSYP